MVGGSLLIDQFADLGYHLVAFISTYCVCMFILTLCVPCGTCNIEIRPWGADDPKGSAWVRMNLSIGVGTDDGYPGNAAGMGAAMATTSRAEGGHRLGDGDIQRLLWVKAKTDEGRYDRQCALHESPRGKCLSRAYSRERC